MQTSGEYSHLTGAEVEEKLASSDPPLLIDVRDDWEFQRYHIPEAVHIPLDEVALRTDEIDQDREIICVCEHGMRSETAAEYLASSGYPRVFSMEGGMAAYKGTVMSGK